MSGSGRNFELKHSQNESVIFLPYLLAKISPSFNIHGCSPHRIKVIKVIK